jgi:uncharacterized membrane protein YeiB
VTLEATERASAQRAEFPTGKPAGAEAAAVSVKSRGRMLGIDMARALALIGMVAVHVGPEDAAGLGGRLYALAHGRASILFVLVAGIGVTLLASRGGSASARLRLACFCLVLLPMGLALQLVAGPIAVILHHYAAFFLVGLAVINLRSRTVFALALATTLLGPMIYFAAGLFDPQVYDGRPVTLLDNPFTILKGLIISGPYPLVVWSAPLLFGVWLGRQDLREHGTQMRLCYAGALLAAAAMSLSLLLVSIVGEPGGPSDPAMLVIHAAHSQMPLWLLSAIGAAMFVLGLSLLFATRFPGVARPFALLGQMALSMYVTHVLILGLLFRQQLNQDAVGPSLLLVALLTAGGMTFAVIWRKFHARGPVEILMHLLPSLMERTLNGQPAARAAPEPNDGDYMPRRTAPPDRGDARPAARL